MNMQICRGSLADIFLRELLKRKDPRRRKGQKAQIEIPKNKINNGKGFNTNVSLQVISIRLKSDSEEMQ